MDDDSCSSQTMEEGICHCHEHGFILQLRTAGHSLQLGDLSKTCLSGF